jgi:hypothetical protein
MSWKPPPDTDTEVRQWMKMKGWAAMGVKYDDEREIYSKLAHSLRSGIPRV